MIFLKALKMSLDRNSDFGRIFNGKEMTYNLRILLCLTRQSKRRISLFLDFAVSHDLNDFYRLWNVDRLRWRSRHPAIHQCRLWMKRVKKRVL